jgi:hypothetical protein
MASLFKQLWDEVCAIPRAVIYKLLVATWAFASLATLSRVVDLAPRKSTFWQIVSECLAVCPVAVPGGLAFFLVCGAIFVRLVVTQDMHQDEKAEVVANVTGFVLAAALCAYASVQALAWTEHTVTGATPKWYTSFSISVSDPATPAQLTAASACARKKLTAMLEGPHSRAVARGDIDIAEDKCDEEAAARAEEVRLDIAYSADHAKAAAQRAVLAEAAKAAASAAH